MDCHLLFCEIFPIYIKNYHITIGNVPYKFRQGVKNQNVNISLQNWNWAKILREIQNSYSPELD